MTVDWSLLEIEEVRSHVSMAAERVHRTFRHSTTVEDLRQEGMIFAATKADLRKSIKDGKWLLFRHGLEMDLYDHCRGVVRRQGQDISFEVLAGDDGDGV